MKLEKSAPWKKLRCIASHSFWAWLRCASLFWAELGCFCIVLRLTVLHCVESPIRFFLRLPVLLYSDLRSHDALRFSSYSMLVCMTDLKLLRYLRLCSVLTWWPGTEPWREMALKGIYCLSAAAPSPWGATEALLLVGEGGCLPASFCGGLHDCIRRRSWPSGSSLLLTIEYFFLRCTSLPGKFFCRETIFCKKLVRISFLLSHI